jgi:hypothetical protein
MIPESVYRFSDKIMRKTKPGSVMKLLFAVMAICGTVAAASRAEAQNYPWCSYYTASGGGGTNCGFTTFAQCMDNVRGIGGFCDRNTQYRPAGGSNLPTKLQAR